MAYEQTPLWSPAVSKEALDLMVAIWPNLPEQGRNALIEQILSGPSIPPVELEGQEERERRQRWVDRRVFERLALIERIGEPPLTTSGEKKLAALRSSYAEWRLEEGARAHFSIWSESDVGFETDRSPDELRVLSSTALVDALRAEGPDREGRLSVWTQVVAGRPGRGLGLLLSLSANPGPGDVSIWRSTLHGLREAMVRPAVARRVVAVLIRAPDQVVADPSLLSSTSDALEAASKQQPLPISEIKFLRLWDRLVEACLRQEAEDPPEDHNWVSRAINRPIGRLTEALLNVMFRRGLKANAKFPEMFATRLDRLSADNPDNLRLARTILASRLLYLFAVDPTWTRSRLVPGFDWQSSEEEATALWRGYGWSARINPELWGELSPHLYDAFTPERTERLGDASETLASLLMVAGVEFPEIDVPTDKSRRALRMMAAADREAAASWLYRFLAGPPVDEHGAPIGVEQVRRVDRLWAERILPWLRRVWPREASFVSPQVSEQFALLAIATDQMLAEAVDFLLPYMTGTDRWGYTVRNMLRSRHPTDHPKAVLRLLGKIVLPSGPFYTSDLRAVLDRIVTADPELLQDAVYKAFDVALRAIDR
jgi:hypothetical protein